MGISSDFINIIPGRSCDLHSRLPINNMPMSIPITITPKKKYSDCIWREKIDNRKHTDNNNSLYLNLNLNRSGSNNNGQHRLICLRGSGSLLFVYGANLIYALPLLLSQFWF